MPDYSRIAFAQLSVNPAYVDQAGISLMHEPTFPTEDGSGLHALADIKEVSEFRTNMARLYVAHVSAKFEILAAFSANHGAELLVLPEYSVPSGALHVCRKLSDGLKLVLVAGSHVCTSNSFADYEQAGLDVGSDSTGHAICPVFIPGQRPHIFEKLTRSKWEASLIPGRPYDPIPIRLGPQAVQLQVSICLDALTGIRVERKRSSKKVVPGLVVIPSLSPTVNLFYDQARLVLASDQAVAFVNVSEFGGSRIFARTGHANWWRTADDGSEPLPKFSEALVIVELDPSTQFEKRKSTTEHFPVGRISTFPLLYMHASSESREYAELLDSIESTAPSAVSDLSDRAKRFAVLDERVFPALLQEKIKYFLSHIVANGLADDANWRNWLTPVVIRSTTSTDLLRWEFCGTAIRLVNDLTMSPSHQDRTDQLTSVYKSLVNKRKELGKRVALSATSSRGVAASVQDSSAMATLSTSFEPPFYNREAAFDRVRRFVESSEKTLLVVAGIRGIGKTSLAREVFRKVLPPTWRNISLSLTEGVSYARLLLELAHRCGLRMPPETPESVAAQTTVAQDILLYFSQTPRLALVIDDLQYLLDPAGEFLDLNVASFLSQLAQRCVSSRNKLIFITTAVPRLDAGLTAKAEVFYLSGLDRKNSEILLAFWFHFEREDLRGQAVQFPERLLSVLGGHPLGLRVAAKVWAENPFSDADLSVFKKLRETVIAYILDRVTLTPREEEFVRFASIFRLPVDRGAFVRWRADEAAFLIDSFVGRSFLETDGERYQLHPIIRDYFYNSSAAPILQPYHRLAGTYFIDSYTKAKTSGAGPDPELLAEAIHHFLAAGEREKVRSFGLYKYELQPVALSHYRRGEYDQALKDYSVLVALDRNDSEAHFHLALIYARKNTWDQAEEHFGKAMVLKPGAFWILQGYGHAKMAAHKLAEAEHLLNQAEQIRPTHSPTLVDLGRLREREGRYAEAEDFFSRAVDADQNNAFAYHAYAKFLLQQGRYTQGLEMALASVEVNPRDSRNRELVNELRRRIDAATKPAATARRA